MSKRLRGAVAIGVLVAGLAGMRPLPSFAATTVPFDCSNPTESALSTDITTAGSGGTVTFNCTSATTIPFTSPLALSQSVTLDASGATGTVTFDGGGTTQLLIVNPGVSPTVKGLTLAHGYAAGPWGGAIQNSGSLAIANTTFSGNSASAVGGAISNTGNGTLTIRGSTLSGNSTPSYAGGIINAGTLSITSSSLSGNSACFGGALFNNPGGTVTITSSTLSGNSTSCDGGAIQLTAGSVTITASTLANNATSTAGGAIANFGSGSTVTIVDSTLSGNSALSGGGIKNAGGASLSIGGTIIASSPSGDNCGISGNSGPLTDLGSNLSDDSSCGFSSAKGDLTNTNPQLGPLQDNGGPTQTMALAPTSPAIDWIPAGQAGCPSSGTTTDQRGQNRPDNGESTCDIGAYESAYPESATHFSVSAPTSTVAGNPINLTVTALDDYGNVATGYTGTVHFTTSDSGSGHGLPGNYTFTAGDNGVHTFSNGITLATAGSQTITATDTASSSIMDTATIQVNPAAASHFTVSAPSTATVGDTVSVSVTAQDAYGNIATGYGGTVHLTSTDGQASLPADNTLTNGTGTFSVTVKSAGTQTVTASDTTSSSLNGTSGSITVAPATPQISWTTPADITYGTALSATQLDATATVNGQSVAGTFVYTPAAGTILNAGKGQTLSVNFTPTDTTDYTVPSTTSVTINVNPAPLTITPTNLSMTYRGTVPAYTWTATFVNGDTSAALTTQPTCVARDGSGTPVSSSTPAGVYTITCTGAVDPNYTINNQTGTLTVLYGTGGYLQPVNDTAHSETCGSPCPMSIFKAGQTIPFKFQIKDASGTVIGPDPNPVTFTATYAGTTSNPVDESTPTGTPTTGTTFTWTGTMYQYNWKSPNQSGSLYRITATFANGQTIQVTIGLR